MVKTTSELMRIVSAGGIVDMPASAKLTSEFMKIAAAARSSDGALRLTDCDAKLTSELMRIAAVAPGKVTFSFNK